MKKIKQTWQPIRPTKPHKMVDKWTKIASIRANSNLPIPFKCPKATFITIGEIEQDHYDGVPTGDVEIVFCKKERIPNPIYKNQFEIYEKNLITYKEQLKEWESYQKELKVKQAENRKKLYRKLKKEFESK